MAHIPPPASQPNPARSGFIGTFGVAGAIVAICVGLPLLGCAVLAVTSLFGR